MQIRSKTNTTLRLASHILLNLTIGSTISDRFERKGHVKEDSVGLLPRRPMLQFKSWKYFLSFEHHHWASCTKSETERRPWSFIMRHKGGFQRWNYKNSHCNTTQGTLQFASCPDISYHQFLTENVSGLRGQDTRLPRQMVRSSDRSSGSRGCTAGPLLPLRGVLVLHQEGLKGVEYRRVKKSRDFNFDTQG